MHTLPRSFRDVLLFDEDFDLGGAPHPGPGEPEVIAPGPPPPCTEAELEQARRSGYEDGVQAGRAASQSALQAETRATLSAIAATLAETRAESLRFAEAAADGIARTLLQLLASVLPETCAAHGAREAAAVARAILPGLATTPGVTVELCARNHAAVAAELQALPPSLPGQVALLPSDALLPGDIRITWQDGEAVRDTRALWSAITGILAPLGLAAASHPEQEPAHA